MNQLSVKYEDYTFIIHNNGEAYGNIAFDENNVEATLRTGETILRAVRGADKNIVLMQGAKALFTFKFDYLWGGAELVVDGADTGFDIKGRWFKPGTRLTDEEDKDLVVAVKKGNGLVVSILDEQVSPVMIIATIYYHIYASGGKMRSLLASTVVAAG
jgi:hypothetical protein